jgi:DNA-binding transcriptional LysR family regulator
VTFPEITLDLVNSDRISDLVEESIDMAVGSGWLGAAPMHL